MLKQVVFVFSDCLIWNKFHTLSITLDYCKHACSDFSVKCRISSFYKALLHQCYSNFSAKYKSAFSIICFFFFLATSVANPGILSVKCSCLRPVFFYFWLNFSKLSSTPTIPQVFLYRCGFFLDNLFFSNQQEVSIVPF